MAEQVEIFRASVEDAIEILALQELSYQSEAKIYDDWSIPSAPDCRRVRDEFSISEFLKAVSKHSIIGSGIDSRNRKYLPYRQADCAP